MAYHQGYGQQNPAMKYEMQNAAVPIPAQSVTVVTQRPKWSWCSLVWAAISVWCCTIFGFIGLLFSVLSYVDHKSGDFERSDRKRRCSWGWSITAIVLGVIGIIMIIVLYAVLWTAVSNNTPDPGYNWNGY